MREIKNIITASIVAIMAAVPTTALADGRAQASGTINVTVVIAPIGAAVAAARQGAIGLWSIGGGNQGFLIQAPAALAVGETGEVSIFAQQTDSFVIRSDADKKTLPLVSKSSQRGLARRSFSLQPYRQPGIQRFTISSL